MSCIRRAVVRLSSCIRCAQFLSYGESKSNTSDRAQPRQIRALACFDTSMA
jgi:hypothetical protein